MKNLLQKSLQRAFINTLPILSGYLVLGMAYGIYMRSLGFGAIYPILMATLIYAGSVEFIAASFLLSAFNPLYVFVITLMVSARQIFYSIALIASLSSSG